VTTHLLADVEGFYFSFPASDFHVSSTCFNSIHPAGMEETVLSGRTSANVMIKKKLLSK